MEIKCSITYLGNSKNLFQIEFLLVVEIEIFALVFRFGSYHLGYVGP